MLVPAQHRRWKGVLRKRDDNRNTVKNVAIIAISIFTLLGIAYLLTRKFRRPVRSRSATSLSGKPLPWYSWKRFRRRTLRNEYSTSLQDTAYRGHHSNSAPTLSSREMSGARSIDPERQIGSANADGGVDRHTSVRSVMTLPPYSPAARENERILGREGERAGMDNVVELPETLDEEEATREEEMESLYQIRLARRVEAADREARRQARRDARARGDIQALAEIRRRAEEAADLSVSQLLIAEHQNRTKTRERRVSSVAYGDLGVARHDGTRVRANSSESDRRPLLDSAASISGGSARERSGTNTSLGPDSHRRGLSVTSTAQSYNSRGSEELDFTDAPRTLSVSTFHSTSNGNGNNTTPPTNNSDEFETATLHPTTSVYSYSNDASRATSFDTHRDIPAEDAPAYEDPPNYESPVSTRAPQLPGLARLPSIHVTPDSTVEGRARAPGG